jgi:glycosyltransferase involved in cell wall biosynthesis
MEKKIKVCILVNTLQNVNSFVYSNHIHFFTYTAKTRPDIEFVFFTPHRMSIDNARNTAADIAMKSKSDYLMFIDDDVLIPKDSLIKLLEANKDIICGLGCIRGIPFNVMAFRWKEFGEKHDDRIHEEDTKMLTYYNNIPLDDKCLEGHAKFDVNCTPCHSAKLKEIVECDAIGFSCALIKTDVLPMLTEPYFVTGKHHTEDVYFCMKVKSELDPAPGIFIHTGVQWGHMLNSEPIEWKTRLKFQEFYAYEINQMLKPNDTVRDPAYIEKCLARIGGSDVK